MKLKTVGQCAFGSLLAIIVILAGATIVEKFYGSGIAYEKIYGAWWIILVWMFLIITSLTYIIGKWQARPPMNRIAFLFHISFVIILLGAFVTYLTAERGYVHIRQGEIANYYTSEEDSVKRSLPFHVKLVLFDIEYHSGTSDPADFISFLKIDDEIVRVSMNKIYKGKGYRLYQLSYDSDEMGTTLLVNYDPWGTGITYFGYLLLAVTMLLLLLCRIGWKGLIAIIIPTALLWYYVSQINPMTPILRSPMLAAHVSVIMIAYISLLIVMILGIIGLSSEKRRAKMYRWNTFLLYPALFLLAAGIFIGAVWANISWGRYWGWDAKETWALITLLVYAFPFHRKSLPLFRKQENFLLFCVFAFLTILMTFFGVSYFLGGIHSYL
jgi:ABC-type transport system involved in cytochrome c biogenesis, permease component